MTTLILARHAPESRTLARLIAHDVGVPSSWEVNANVRVDTAALVVDLFDADHARVEAACHEFLDQHGIEWEVRS